MPMQKLNYRPGVNTQLSRTSNEAGWSDSDKIRFRDGLPQKVGGWVRAADATLVGVPRVVWAWQELGGALDAAFGTNSRLFIFQGGGLYDITPYQRIVTVTSPATTVAGSPIVTITDTANGAALGDVVYITGGSSVGGLTLSGPYTILSILSANSYTIQAASNATSSATGGGAMVLSYLLAEGANNAVIGSGFGVGPYGGGTYGTPRPATALTLALRQWSLANWGEFLLALPRGSALYVWTPAMTTSGRAIQVVNGSVGPPLINNVMLIGQPERHCILLGCSALNSTTSYDPMLVRFSDVEDFTSWQASPTNSAGSFRIQGGTKLMGGINTTNQTLLWSDTEAFSMRFIGLPYVYRFDRVGNGCGLIGIQARADHNGTVFWMGKAGFYAFNGGAPSLIPCPVWQTVFDDLPTAVDQTQGDKVTCGMNVDNNEVWWFYPSIGQAGSEPDRYVKYNFTEGLWDIGTLNRTAWLDHGVWQQTIATDENGVIYYHEEGVDAAGQPLNSWIESGYQDIGDGTDFVYVDQIIPDFGVSQSGNVYITVKVTDYPNRAPRVIGPFPLSKETNYLSMRARGRQIATRFETTDLGANFRLGAVRVRASSSGRK